MLMINKRHFNKIQSVLHYASDMNVRDSKRMLKIESRARNHISKICWHSPANKWNTQTNLSNHIYDNKSHLIDWNFFSFLLFLLFLLFLFLFKQWHLLYAWFPKQNIPLSIVRCYRSFCAVFFHKQIIR